MTQAEQMNELMAGMALGHSEAQYEAHRHTVATIAANPELYPDTPPKDAGWILFLVEKYRMTPEIFQQMINGGLPMICWSTNMLDKLSGGAHKKHGYLIAIYQKANTNVANIIGNLRILECYWGNARLAEVHNHQGAWHIQFTANC